MIAIMSNEYAKYAESEKYGFEKNVAVRSVSR
jgi:hypothetical protein